MFLLCLYIKSAWNLRSFAGIFICVLCVAACSGASIDKSLVLNKNGVYQDVNSGSEDTGTLNAYDLNSGAYRIGSSDKINITVFGENDLSKDYVVNNIGYISFPLIGSIYAEGLTLKQLEERIREKLMDGYLKNPSISAQMAEFRPFYILGEVRVPGSYAFVSDMSVLNAVALSGGYTYRANQDVVEIMQGGKPTQGKSDSRKVRRVNPEAYRVRPGDIILVKERFF